MDSETIMKLRSNAAYSVIPAGYFAKFGDLAKESQQPARVRKLPVLSVRFDEALQKSGSPHLFHLGWGAIDSERMPILTFRVQFNDLMVYWLANPADEEVWRVMDQWNTVGTIVLAPVLGDQALLMSRDFALVPKAEALRSWTKQGAKTTQLFLQSAGTLILSGDLAAQASSDIPAVPRLKRVIGCIVSTNLTDVRHAPH